MTLRDLSIRGTITECTGGPVPSCEKVVYQSVAPGCGNLRGNGTYNKQRRRWVKPTDPHTPAQMTRRAAFAAAVFSWQIAPQATRDAWNLAARGSGMSGFNRWISRHL